MVGTRNGHDLANTLKKYSSNYFAPNKNRYLIQNKAELIKIMKESEDVAMSILENSPIRCKFSFFMVKYMI